MVAVQFFLGMAVLIEIGGGLSVLFGFKARMGASALIIFLITASLIFHRFWAVEGMEHQNQMIHFLKNVSIMGGLLLIVAFGSGPLSFDQRRTKPS